jgi:hypothetical protein
MSMMTEQPDLGLVYVVNYDHIGVTLWGIEKLEQNLAEEFDRLARYPDFKIGWDHEAYAYDYLAEHAPETLGRNVEGNYWTAVSDGEVGLAIFNRRLMGAIREADGAFSVPLAFSMFYIWDMAYAEGSRLLEGTYRYELAVVPFGGDWREADLHRRALAYNFPCVVCSANTLREPLGAVWTPCQVNGAGAILSALYPCEKRTYARFYEHRGEHTRVSVAWEGSPARLIEVDLRERPVSPLGHVLPLGPWQIRTVELVSLQRSGVKSDKHKEDIS